MAALVNKAPLEGDGLIENLYHYLWEKDGLDRGPTGVRIPDTVVFKLRSPVAWYFTSAKDSTIKRKRSINLTMAKIEEAFLSGHGSSGVIAYFIDAKSLSAAGPQIEYFDEEGLTQFLKDRRNPLSGILQKFVEPKGGKNSMIRAVWAPKLCLCERRENTKRLWDTRYSIFERTVTFEGKPHNSVLVPVRGSALPRQVQGVCESVVFHVAQVTSLKCRVSRMVLSMKTDASGRLWLLWASSLRTEGAKLEVATADAVMGKAGSSSPSGIAALKKATRDGLTAPQSVMGPLSLTCELGIPRQRQPDLEGLTPVLAPGVQMAGAATGPARRSGATSHEGSGSMIGGASSGTGGGDGFASMAAETQAMSERRAGLRGASSSAGSVSDGDGARGRLVAAASASSAFPAGSGGRSNGGASDLTDLDELLAQTDAAASRLDGSESTAAGTGFASEHGIARPGGRRPKGGRRGRRNSLVLDNEEMQEIAEAGDIGPPKPGKAPGVKAAAAAGSATGRADEESSRAAETAWLSPLRNQNTGVERGLLASSLQHDAAGLPVLGERQCLSCGAAKPPGVKPGPVSGRSTGSRPTEGFAVQYKTVIQHHTALLEELGLDPWWQIDGTVPSEGDAEGDDAIAAAQAALSAEEAFDQSLGIHAQDESKSRRAGPPPARECPLSSMWPVQTDLVVSAAGGVGMYGVLPDSGSAGPAVPVHPIPQILRLKHPELTCGDYRWYMQDPLFLYKNVEVCEACLLVYAKFAQCITESKPPEFALRQCMGPRAANRVSRALLAGLLPGQQATGSGRGADARAKKREATRAQQQVATAHLHALSGSLASIPESGAASKVASGQSASRARNPRHRDAFTEFFAAQEPPSMPSLSSSQASIMRMSPRGSAQGRASGGGSASASVLPHGALEPSAGGAAGAGGSVPDLPYRQSHALSLARGWSAAPDQWRSGSGDVGGLMHAPADVDDGRYALRTAPHGGGMGAGGGGLGGISTTVTSAGLGLTGVLGRNGLVQEAGGGAAASQRGPVMHSGHPLGFMASDRPGVRRGGGAGIRPRMASDSAAMAVEAAAAASASSSSAAAFAQGAPPGGPSDLVRIRTANARPHRGAFAASMGVAASAASLRQTTAAGSKLGTAGLRVTFSPGGAGSSATGLEGSNTHGPRRLGSAGSLSSGGIHTPLASTGALIAGGPGGTTRGSGSGFGAAGHGGTGGRGAAVGSSPMRSPGGRHRGAPVPVEARQPFDNHHGPGASAHIETYRASGTAADAAASEASRHGRGVGKGRVRPRKGDPKLPKSSPFYAAVAVPMDEKDERRLRRARAIAKQKREMAKVEADREEQEASGWGSKSEGKRGANRGGSLRTAGGGNVPLSERYGDLYDEAATAAGTATKRGVEASRAAAAAEHSRSIARADSERDTDATKHKSFLEDTKRAVEEQLAKRDQLIELLGYNPVQDEAAKVIQVAAKRKIDNNRAAVEARS